MSDTQKWAIDMLVRGLLAISLGVSGWALITAVDHETRLSVMEDNRFTVQDGMQLRRDVETDFRFAVEEIKDCLNHIQRDETCD